MIRRKRKTRKFNSEINVVPYIDVMMVLLVIFMVTAPMLTQGVNVELPKAAADPVDSKDNEPVIITVDRDGHYYIDVGGDPQQPVAQDAIGARVQKILAANPGKMLLVKGDKSVDYNTVVQLMVTLQSAGAPSVGLVTE
ncbi:protein TolR [Marinobacterium arenosum]|uniref:protein TolR n=1 Tax=Marinobacterium arenosum TaxID=2862496 RepID=UPI001C96CB46|nr:protein TolR [Marinobacterium arenosum]MBY4675294.1 protein TolR [Marinobacterium arenosum]